MIETKKMKELTAELKKFLDDKLKDLDNFKTDFCKGSPDGRHWHLSWAYLYRNMGIMRDTR